MPADPAAGSRTNVGVFNPGNGEMSVTLMFYDAAGSPLGSFVRAVSAKQALQINDAAIFETLGIVKDVPSFYVILEGDGISPIQTYAAVIDNQSQDPFLVRGAAVRIRPFLDISYRATVPAAASLHGRQGAFFSSDVVVLNVGGLSPTVTFRYHCFLGPCGNAEQTITLAPGEMRLLSDIGVSLFGAPETGGAIEIESQPGIGTVVSLRVPRTGPAEFDLQ